MELSSSPFRFSLFLPDNHPLSNLINAQWFLKRNRRSRRQSKCPHNITRTAYSLTRLAENHHKTASGPNRDRALSRAPPASSASSRLRSATQVSPNHTRARPSSSVSAPGHKGVHGKVKDEDLTIIITQRKFTNGTFHYLTSKSAHSLDLPPAAIPGHEPKPGDVYLHENSTKLSDSATQVRVMLL